MTSPRNAGPVSLPTNIKVWSLHVGRVVDGARDRKIMGNNYTFKRSERDNDRCTVWAEFDPEPLGPLLGQQGSISMMGMYVWGVMKSGAIVTVEQRRHDELIEAADSTVTNWWAPSVVEFDDGTTELGLLFATTDEAVACAHALDVNRVIGVSTTMFNASGHEDGNVRVLDLDKRVLAQTSLPAHACNRPTALIEPLAVFEDPPGDDDSDATEQTPPKMATRGVPEMPNSPRNSKKSKNAASKPEKPQPVFSDVFYRHGENEWYATGELADELFYLAKDFERMNFYGGVFSSTAHVWELMDGRVRFQNGYGWGSASYTSVTGVRLVRLLAHKLGAKPARRLKDDTPGPLPTIEELEAEFQAYLDETKPRDPKGLAR